MNIVLAAGFATAPSFMEPLERHLRAIWKELPSYTKFIYAFPYGDWGRSRWKQLRELRHDIFAERGSRFQSVGGVRLLSQLQSECREGPVVMIGHSGGGVAAVHAAARWSKADPDLCLQHSFRLILVGAPRCRVPDDWKASTMYVYNCRADGRRKDLVAGIGSWGGWDTDGRRWPRLRWNEHRHAPGTLLGLPLLGSHPDYFRDSAPFVNEQGKCNLDQVGEAIRLWLFQNEATKLVQPSFVL